MAVDLQGNGLFLVQVEISLATLRAATTVCLSPLFWPGEDTLVSWTQAHAQENGQCT